MPRFKSWNKKGEEEIKLNCHCYVFLLRFTILCQTRPLWDPSWCRQSIQSFDCVSCSSAMLSPENCTDRNSWKTLPLTVSVPCICCWQPKVDNKRYKHSHHPPSPVTASLLHIQEVQLPADCSWKPIIILNSWLVTEYEPASNLSARSPTVCLQAALSPRHAVILNFRTRPK